MLVVMWALSVGIDRLWLALDRSVPSWDPADHLIGALNYSWMIRNADWLSAEWWHGIWTLSSKYPPLLYVSTAPFIRWFGSSADAATVVNSVYTAILLVSVYGIGRLLFSSSVGLWAAGLCVLFPQFYVLRSQYFMDYPLTAWVAAAFCVLTYWATRSSDHPLSAQRWLSAIAFGILFGLASLTKQTAVMFLGIPLLWLGIQSLWRRRWGQFIQLVVGSAITGLMMLPWSRTNWLFQISAAFSANTRSADIEGDPSALTIEGWTFYLTHLPKAVSYPLLVTAVLGLLIFLINHRRSSSSQHAKPNPLQSLGWLLVFIAGTYVIWSAIANKDARYIMPYLPMIAVVLGVGMAAWRRWWAVIPWATVGFSIALMLTNLFTPVSQTLPGLAKVLTPGSQHPVYLGTPWPHAEIIDELTHAQPYQLINLGVLPSTPEINQHNLNYFGTQSDFQVYARRMGKSQEHIDQDMRSMDWFVSVTRPQLNHHDDKSRRRQLAIAADLRRSPEFKRQRRWDLPDGSRLDLFRRRRLPIQVTPLASTVGASANAPNALGDATNAIELTHIKVPRLSVAGQPIPVTYTWQGSWDALAHGTVILTWRRDLPSAEPRSNPAPNSTQWFHDHSIGFGTLRPHPIQANQSMLSPSPDVTATSFKVVEHTAMQSPHRVQPGLYRLTASYMDRNTGETVPLMVPGVAIRVLASEPDADDTLLVGDDGNRPRENRETGTARASMSPEVDWVSQLRNLSTALPEGIDALSPVFDQIGRFSLYDPIQSYAHQAEVTLAHRLKLNPTNIENAYALTLAQVLQRDAEGAIATLTDLTALDANNPYAHGYLAFVNLYALHPHAASDAISRAIALDPEVQEFKLLRVAASVMGGNLWQAWQDGWAIVSD
jgi:4-amino-4-deoxy-L-arabinose transferase-like glycosyltransferase